MTPARAELRRRALARLEQGFTLEAVAREVGVSIRTLARWRAAERAERAAHSNPEPPPLAASAPAAPIADGAGVIAVADAIVRENLAVAAEARMVGNHAAAARALRVANESNAARLRAERQQHKDQDGVWIPRDEIERADREVDDLLATLASVPLTCSVCGRALRVRLASDGVEDH